MDVAIAGVVFVVTYALIAADRLDKTIAALLGGIAFERTGSYDVVWWLSVLFGVMSALINLPIVEKPVVRMAAKAA